MAGIEFLDVDPPPGDDEQLPAPPARRLPGTPRGRGIAGGLAVVALVIGAVVVRGAGSGNPVATPSRATSSPTPSPSTDITLNPDTGGLTVPGVIFCPSTGTPHPVNLVPVNGETGPGGSRTFAVQPVPSSEPSSEPASSSPTPRIPGVRTDGNEAVSCSPDDPSFCPEADDGQLACTATGELPSAVVQAIRQRYPGATYVSSQSEVVRETHLLWFRSVALTAPRGVRITVVVEQGGHDPGLSGDLDNGSKELARAVHRATSTNTIVEVTAPSGTHTDVDTALALAADPRLLAVG